MGSRVCIEFKYYVMRCVGSRVYIEFEHYVMRCVGSRASLEFEHFVMRCVKLTCFFHVFASFLLRTSIVSLGLGVEVSSEQKENIGKWSEISANNNPAVR